MQQQLQSTFDKSADKPYSFKAYKITKKVIKYVFYIALLCFAYNGFMAWK